MEGNQAFRFLGLISLFKFESQMYIDLQSRVTFDRVVFYEREWISGSVTAERHLTHRRDQKPAVDYMCHDCQWHPFPKNTTKCPHPQVMARRHATATSKFSPRALTV